MATKVARLGPARGVIFDFGNARDLDAVSRNISGIALHDHRAWTVSDETRTFECFVRKNGGFVLDAQFDLDDFFPDLPEGKEADLESVDISGGRLWLCGSHCRVRLEASSDGSLSPEIRSRPSRHLLGSIWLDSEGMPVRTTAKSLPFTGEGSLRRALRANAFLEPFVEMASKENGLDIEGMAVFGKKVLFGLRGPVIDGHAVVVSVERDGGLIRREIEPKLRMFDLRGLGVRDLCRDGRTVLILAGPATGADGPFTLHRWRRASSGNV